MPWNHHHTLLFLPDCAEAGTFLKQTIFQVLSTTNNAHVKLMTVSYPEDFLSRNKQQISRQFHFSKRREDEIPHESENHRRTWLQIQKCVGVRKTQFLGRIRWVRESIVFFQRLLELESSDAPFKDSILSYIDLLQKGFGRFYVTEHSRTLDIDLGVTNAQCTCFECMTQPLQIIGSTAQEGNNYASQLFSVYDEDTIIDTSFL